MLPPFKLIFAALCLLSTIVLYGRNRNSSLAGDVISAESSTLETTTSLPYEISATTPDPSKITSQNRTSKIIQATMMFGHNYKGLNEKTLQNHAEHAERWGYGNQVLTREIVGAGETDGEGYWTRYIFSKLLFVLKIMTIELEKPHDKRAEWIVWYDADTLILNPNIQWEIFLPPADNDAFSDIKMIVTKDISGFNAGLFFCRVDEWTIDLFTDSCALPRLRPEIDIVGNIEQNAMKWMFSQEQNRKHVVYQPSIWYNWFASIERPDSDVKGDMVIHFSGLNHDGEGQMKHDVMEIWFSKLQIDRDAWHVPLKETRYPKEVPAFWELYRKAKEILSVVEDRGNTILVEKEQTLQIARMKLKYAIEQEADDVEKVKASIHDMMEARRALDRPEEQALLEAFEKQEATGTLAQNMPDVDAKGKVHETISAPKSSTGDNQDMGEALRQRFNYISPVSENNPVVHR